MNRRSKFVLVVLLVALIISVALNALLFSRAKQYYIDLSGVRLDPLGLSNFFEAPTRTSGKIRVVFYGDSRAAHWPILSADDRFEFINRGIEGQTTAQVLFRFDYHLAPLHPQIVILQVGVNDLKSIPLFLNQKDEIIANCKENIRQIIERSNELGATVIVSTIFPVGNPPLVRQPFWSADILAAIGEVNQYIRSLSQPRVIILDTDPILSDGKQLKLQYAQDELHINAQGYRAVNEELAHILQKID